MRDRQPAIATSLYTFGPIGNILTCHLNPLKRVGASPSYPP